ncbi:hypothetical protein GOBAR_AA02941 [Gossypium barbadense]|uniref:Uncharacterized protein n=1 Tax=Gossypium barbadense TaxID=3634 RepID=A0A2P5YPZ5_GOSBA|nr:hypothetical protein GOBAR_AA02941 [Gossypium barbadense]
MNKFNIGTALKSQQASIQGLKTQIGQLSKLIFKRPQGSLPSNTEPNPREQLNAINVQDEEGFVDDAVKFISVSETRFQNTETALKSQQASIQGLKTQIGQLSKLIFKRPQGSLPSNTEPNPREQLNAINVQDEEGFVEPEPEPRQETMVSRGQGEEMSLKEAHESFSSSKRGAIHEDRRLQIEELDEWQTHKPRTHDKPKLHQNKPNTFPRQLKVRDKVLLDVADPYIVKTTLNEEIPLTVLSIFPFGTVEVSHPKFGTFKVNNTRLKPYFNENDSRNEEYKLLEPP